jgi:hypothetical protein
MTIEIIKQKIAVLAKKHTESDENTIDDFTDAELLEKDARDLIVQYCENQGYLINGFPTEMKRRYENDEITDEEYEEDYFCEERYALYLDMLTIEKADVAELTWHYTRSFWPEQFESKEAYLEHVKSCVEDIGFYDLRL